jgi:precorrin-6Y C5,15-methyltransferase (decarboxylating)
MVTIAGNGMGAYDFSNLDLDLSQFDVIICDKNFTPKANNILKFAFKEAKAYVLKHYEEKNILYVVTGSPLFFSAGLLIANKLPKEQVNIINNTSCKSYLLEKLFISETQVNVISIHGRTHIDLERFLTQEYTFIVCDKNSIQRLKDALFYIKPEDITITIGYKLGYEDECIEEVDLYHLDVHKFDLSEPFVLLLQRNFEPKSPVCEDTHFNTERGMITKKYKRHLSLQNLDLLPNDILWDIGAGSGSCGIEAYKRYKTKTLFFEKNETRVSFINENLSHHHVVDCQLFVGEAQKYFETIEQNPNKIFVGGGGEKVIEKLPYLYERLEDSGIMLINAITLKHLSQMIQVLNEANIEFQTHSLSLTTYKGTLDLVEPERQLFQIKIYK